jgi:hypothetical protein
MVLYRRQALTVEDAAKYADAFFSESSQAFAGKLFASAVAEATPCFVSLDVTSVLVHANEAERLEAIADGAESEHGQQVLRDLILSFKLPRCVVGLRRTALLNRRANAEARTRCADVLTVAHDAAMRGARWTWENDEDDVHKTCALLAGVAVVMCRSATDAKTTDMFNGLVNLPFLATRAPPHGRRRLAYLSSTNEWVVYSLLPKGTTQTHLRASGFAGVCRALIVFLHAPTSDGQSIGREPELA